MFCYRKEIRLININRKIEKPVKFIILFDFFCMISHIPTNKIFKVNAALLQKLKSKIPFHTFKIKKYHL